MAFCQIICCFLFPLFAVSLCCFKKEKRKRRRVMPDIIVVSNSEKSEFSTTPTGSRPQHSPSTTTTKRFEKKRRSKGCEKCRKLREKWKKHHEKTHQKKKTRRKKKQMTDKDEMLPPGTVPAVFSAELLDSGRLMIDANAYSKRAKNKQARAQALRKEVEKELQAAPMKRELWKMAYSIHRHREQKIAMQKASKAKPARRPENRESLTHSTTEDTYPTPPSIEALVTRIDRKGQLPLGKEENYDLRPPPRMMKVRLSKARGPFARRTGRKEKRAAENTEENGEEEISIPNDDEDSSEENLELPLVTYDTETFTV